MEKITLTSISRKDKVSARTGKPFVSLGLKTQQHGDLWLSGFGNAENAGWKVGDTVEVEVRKETKDGREFLNFDMPKKGREDSARVLAELTTHTLLLREILSHVKPRAKYNDPSHPELDQSNETAFDGEEDTRDPFEGLI